MPKKLTIEEINTRLKSKNIKIVGEYISSTVSTTLECNLGHQWSTRVANVLNRNDGCPKCSGHSSSKQWTTEMINQHLSDRKIKLMAEYTGKVKDKGIFTCSNNHTWTTTIASVLAGRGCKLCYGKNLPLDLPTIQKRVEKLKYTVVEKNTGDTSLLTFTCSEGHTWDAKYYKSKCSSCAAYGFDLKKPAVGYILKFPSFIKYGITNNLDSRLYRHKIHNPEHEIVFTLNFKTGLEAKLWEETIKINFGQKFVDKTQCPDGWTETLDCFKLNDIIKKSLDDFFRKSS